MRIGEIAVRSGVNIQTIRYYERRNLLKKPHRLLSGYRDYSEDTVRILRAIKRYQEHGFTLKELEIFFKQLDNDGVSINDVRSGIEAKIRQINEKISSLERIRDELANGLNTCKCNDGQTMCPNIQSLTISRSKS
jgi:MerR family mercuric resistance operon transcriptional regulator